MPNKKAKRGRGRPTSYRKAFIEQGYKLCRQGMTDKQLADFWGVAESTLNLWKQKHPEFSESLKRGKDEFDTAGVEQALLRRATGYEYEEDVVERLPNGSTRVRRAHKAIPPDVAAIIFWLKNRDPKRWRDKVHHAHGPDPDAVADMDDEALEAAIRKYANILSPYLSPSSD